MSNTFFKHFIVSWEYDTSEYTCLWHYNNTVKKCPGNYLLI